MQTHSQNSGGAATDAQADMFRVVKDGNGYELTIANLDHPVWAANSGIVRVEALRVNPKKVRNTNIKNVIDSATGATFGIFVGVDKISKDFNWENINVKEFEYFDLRNKKERQKFIVLNRHPKMEGSPNQNGKPDFRVIDQEAKASNYIKERSDRNRAKELVENLTHEQRTELAPAFGIRPESNSSVMLEAEILRIADNDHKKFLEVWDNPDRVGMITFKRALKAGLITFHNEPNRMGYYYEAQPLGQTEPSAYKYLTDHVQLLSALNFTLKERESNTIHAFNPLKPTQSNPLEEAQKVIAAQKKEMEEMRAQIANDPKNASSAVPKMEEQESYPNEKDELKAQAKELGIKSPHLMSLDTLRAKVKEEHDKLHS